MWQVTALELESLARLVMTSHGHVLNRVQKGDGVHKAYADDIVLLWHIVRTGNGTVVDEIQVEMAWAHPHRTRETHQRILMVKNGRVTTYHGDDVIESHLKRLALLDILAVEG
jgi:hypothetical protein